MVLRTLVLLLAANCLLTFVRCGCCCKGKTVDETSDTVDDLVSTASSAPLGADLVPEKPSSTHVANPDIPPEPKPSESSKGPEILPEPKPSGFLKEPEILPESKPSESGRVPETPPEPNPSKSANDLKSSAELEPLESTRKTKISFKLDPEPPTELKLPPGFKPTKSSLKTEIRPKLGPKSLKKPEIIPEAKPSESLKEPEILPEAKPSESSKETDSGTTPVAPEVFPVLHPFTMAFKEADGVKNIAYYKSTIQMYKDLGFKLFEGVDPHQTLAVECTQVYFRNLYILAQDNLGNLDSSSVDFHKLEQFNAEFQGNIDLEKNVTYLSHLLQSDEYKELDEKFKKVGDASEDLPSSSDSSRFESLCLRVWKKSNAMLKITEYETQVIRVDASMELDVPLVTAMAFQGMKNGLFLDIEIVGHEIPLVELERLYKRNFSYKATFLECTFFEHQVFAFPEVVVQKYIPKHPNLGETLKTETNLYFERLAAPITDLIKALNIFKGVSTLRLKYAVLGSNAQTYAQFLKEMEELGGAISRHIETFEHIDISRHKIIFVDTEDAAKMTDEKNAMNGEPLQQLIEWAFIYRDKAVLTDFMFQIPSGISNEKLKRLLWHILKLPNLESLTLCTIGEIVDKFDVIKTALDDRKSAGLPKLTTLRMEFSSSELKKVCVNQLSALKSRVGSFFIHHIQV
jgi:hypothetical protein